MQSLHPRTPPYPGPVGRPDLPRSYGFHHGSRRRTAWSGPHSQWRIKCGKDDSWTGAPISNARTLAPSRHRPFDLDLAPRDDQSSRRTLSARGRHHSGAALHAAVRRVPVRRSRLGTQRCRCACRRPDSGWVGRSTTMEQRPPRVGRVLDRSAMRSADRHRSGISARNSITRHRSSSGRFSSCRGPLRR
jgi:hypothetical protein